MLLLQRDEFQAFNPIDEKQTYLTPIGATLLYVQLWGAGGGGGGASTITQSTGHSVGGGGGAGGYVEAWITSPADSYDFHLRRGGLGGIGFSIGKMH